MSQMLLDNVSESREDHIAHLADILLREGKIVSDQMPREISRTDVLQYVADVIPDKAVDLMEYFVNSWGDEEGELDIEAHAKALELTVSVTNEYLDAVLTDNQCDLMQWGPAQ